MKDEPSCADAALLKTGSVRMPFDLGRRVMDISRNPAPAALGLDVAAKSSSPYLVKTFVYFAATFRPMCPASFIPRTPARWSQGLRSRRGDRNGSDLSWHNA